jgi:hypothetical protein
MQFIRTARRAGVDATIDNLIGDEVMALFIRGIGGPEYHPCAVEAAGDYFVRLGTVKPAEPWLAPEQRCTREWPMSAMLAAKWLTSLH